MYILQHNKLSFCTFRWSTYYVHIAGIFEINRRDSGCTNIPQHKTLFCAFEAGDIVCWLVNRGLQSWTCSRLPTVAEFVKLTQSIVIDIQWQSADLYKVQLCNRRHFSMDCLGGYRYSRFDFRVEKNCWEPAEHRLVFITCRSEVTDLPSLSIIFAVFRDFFTEAAIRLENKIS